MQTVLGSSSDPKYLVRFIDYKDSTSTVGRESIRALATDKKRKADAVLPAAPATSSPHVISGPASVNPNAVAAKQESAAQTDRPKKNRTIGSNKALEKKMSSWKEFQAKGPGKKVIKKESMFRTGDGINSRGMSSSHLLVIESLTVSSWLHRFWRRHERNSQARPL